MLDSLPGQKFYRQSEVTNASKFLSLLLRHRPGVIGLTLDPEGWANIEEIVTKSNGRLTRDLIDRAVAENDKARFAVSEDGLRIRARQGHSLEVDLGLKPVTPPEVLYHGTYPAVIEDILRDGLSKMQRQHVHMTEERDSASAVGMRRGAPIILRVHAMRMSQEGYLFYQSENGVWLTEQVPPRYLERYD